MNNEPVAWKVIETDDDGSFTTFIENEPVWANNDIPLYTHPVKQLSDDEIKQIWYDLYPLSSSSYWDDKREGLAELKFARAIIKEITE